MSIGLTYAFVHHVLHRKLSIPLHIHADFQKYHSNACVLANWALAFGTHAAVHQNLRHRIFGSRVFFFPEPWLMLE